MRDNPDMGTQSSEERIDELLNGYIDDELATRQRTEVERLIAHDPGIERRLQQLRKCRTLLRALPCAEALPQILESVKASLASTAVIYEQSSYARRMGRIHLLARKVMSAAAMLALVGLLAGVIYTILSPASSDEGSLPPGGNALAFNGRLEITSDKFREVETMISTAIRENGLSDPGRDVDEPNKRIYYVKCNKRGLDSLLVSFDYVWPRLDSATMVVNTGATDGQVSVDAINVRQIAGLVEQKNQDARIELAKEFATLNTLAGGTLQATADTEPSGLPPIPKPVITGGADAGRTSDVPEADKTIRLTIVLSK